MPRISKNVRDALQNQLSAKTTGFNDRLKAIWAPYELAPDDLWAVDWSDQSANFMFGRAPIVAIQQSSILTFPFVSIDTVRAQNTNYVKFATFSGSIQAVIDVHHSWPQESILADFASYLDATEDAMISALNDQNAQYWPPALRWNGQVACQRGQLAFGGQNWLQTISFLCNFALDI